MATELLTGPGAASEEWEVPLDEALLALSRIARRRVEVPAIRPPPLPLNQERLTMSLHAASQQLQAAVEDLPVDETVRARFLLGCLFVLFLFRRS